jgi:hypothetical protein
VQSGPDRKLLKLDEDVCTKLATALITRYSPLEGPKITSFVAKKYVPTIALLQWGQIQVAKGRDKMCCLSEPLSGCRLCSH